MKYLDALRVPLVTLYRFNFCGTFQFFYRPVAMHKDEIWWYLSKRESLQGRFYIHLNAVPWLVLFSSISLLLESHNLYCIKINGCFHGICLLKIRVMLGRSHNRVDFKKKKKEKFVWSFIRSNEWLLMNDKYSQVRPGMQKRKPGQRLPRSWVKQLQLGGSRNITKTHPIP